MARFILAPEAISDLEAVWAYIAQDNPEAADRVIDSAHDLCRVLAEHPGIGRVRRFPDPSLPELRSMVLSDFPTYVLFYRELEDGVEIVRVVHGAQDIEALFRR